MAAFSPYLPATTVYDRPNIAIVETTVTQEGLLNGLKENDLVDTAHLNLKGQTVAKISFPTAKEKINSTLLSPKSVKPALSERPTPAFQQYNRTQILEQMMETWSAFCTSSDFSEKAAYYSKTKSLIEKIWQYIPQEENKELAEIVVMIHSVMTTQKWRNWQPHQTRLISQLLEKTKSDTLTQKDNQKALRMIMAANLELLPSES